MFRFEKYGNERQYWASEVVRHSVVAVVLLVVGPRTPDLVGPLVVVLSIGLPLEATGLVVVHVHVTVVEVVQVLVLEVVHVLVVEVVHVLVVGQAVSGLGLILGLVKVMGQAVHIVVVVMALVIVCEALV